MEEIVRSQIRHFILKSQPTGLYSNLMLEMRSAMKGKLPSRASLNEDQIDEQGYILRGKCHCGTYMHLHMDIECGYELITQYCVSINWLLFSEINLFYQRLSPHSRAQVHPFLFVAKTRSSQFYTSLLPHYHPASTKATPPLLTLTREASASWSESTDHFQTHKPCPCCNVLPPWRWLSLTLSFH